MGKVDKKTSRGKIIKGSYVVKLVIKKAKKKALPLAKVNEQILDETQK